MSVLFAALAVLGADGGRASVDRLALDLQRYRPALRRCYARVPDEKLPSALKLTFTVSAEGSVSSVETSPKDIAAPLRECLSAVLLRAKFTPQGEPVVVNLPLVFDEQ